MISAMDIPSRKTYLYNLFGLQINSTLRCEELAVTQYLRPGCAIVHVSESETLSLEFPVLPANQWYVIDKQTLWFRIRNIGLFRVADGNCIEFQRDPSLPAGTVEDRDIVVFILGSCLGAILQQRNILTLHASCAVIHGKAVCFAGESGSGKSTTLGMLTADGCSMLSDDVSAIDIEDGLAYIRPAYAQIKLNKDSAIALKLNTEKLDTINRFNNKYALRSPANLVSTRAQLNAIFCLEVSSDVNELEISPIYGAERFATLHRNIYRPQFLAGFCKQTQGSTQVADVANACSVYKIVRPVQSAIDGSKLLTAIYSVIN